MSSAMDVDESSQEMVEGASPATLLMHPLAIVSMSDQYTRITTGGSPLPKTQSVVGLLFGYSNDRACCVTDAEDAPLDNIPQATTQIQLHRAVFPQHVVVGWYRCVMASHSSSNNAIASTCSTSNAPTEEDLYLSLQLQKHYGGTSQPDSSDSEQQDMENNININENDVPFLFALLQVETDDDNGNPPNNESEAELPLQMFAVDTARQVLVGIDDWKLETALAERIAVERVMKEPQPQQQQPESFGNNKDDPTSNNIARQASLLVQATAPMQHSFQAMHERWGRVQDYLEATTTAAAEPADPVLLRQIQGLLLSMGPIAAAAATGPPSFAAHGEEKTAESSSVDELLQQLSLLAKTVTTIQQYTDKVKLVHDTTISASPVGGGIAGLMGGASSSASGRLPRGGLAGLYSNK